MNEQFQEALTLRKKSNYEESKNLFLNLVKKILIMLLSTINVLGVMTYWEKKKKLFHSTNNRLN